MYYTAIIIRTFVDKYNKESFDRSVKVTPADADELNLGDGFADLNRIHQDTINYSSYFLGVKHQRKLQFIIMLT